MNQIAITEDMIPYRLRLDLSIKRPRILTRRKKTPTGIPKVKADMISMSIITLLGNTPAGTTK
jgi:hypothetical protein